MRSHLALWTALALSRSRAAPPNSTCPGNGAGIVHMGLRYLTNATSAACCAACAADDCCKSWSWWRHGGTGTQFCRTFTRRVFPLTPHAGCITGYRGDEPPPPLTPPPPPPPPPPIAVIVHTDAVVHEISPLTLGCHSDSGYSHQARGFSSQMI
eukprot:gene35945-4072_t